LSYTNDLLNRATRVSIVEASSSRVANDTFMCNNCTSFAAKFAIYLPFNDRVCNVFTSLYFEEFLKCAALFYSYISLDKDERYFCTQFHVHPKFPLEMACENPSNQTKEETTPRKVSE